MSDEEISGSVSTSQNLVAQVSQAQSLDAKLDVDGNLVVESFRIDPTNLTLDSLSNTDITNPVDGAYLYYDGSAQKWKDGGSLTTLINSVKTETYPFVKRFNIRRNDYVNEVTSSGQAQSFSDDSGTVNRHFGGATSGSDPLGIPAPYAGTTKRQRININFDHHITASGIAEDAEFDIEYIIRVKSKGVEPIVLGTVKFPTTIVDLEELGVGSGGARRMRIQGNVTDKLTVFGKIAATSGGLDDLDIETFFYNSYMDETEIKYNTGFSDSANFDFSAGDTVYFSAERFTPSGDYYEVVHESKSYVVDLYAGGASLGPFALNGNNNFSENFDIILPETTTKTEIVVDSRPHNDNIGQNHTLKLRKIYGSVENLA